MTVSPNLENPIFPKFIGGSVAETETAEKEGLSDNTKNKCGICNKMMEEWQNKTICDFCYIKQEVMKNILSFQRSDKEIK